ncbi:MAG: transposase [Actinomycetota bacterium]|nr:transposase [Actinomycetota bacterium]
MHRRVRKLRRFLELLRRTFLVELVGEPVTLIVDSTLLEVLYPRQVKQSSGFDGAAWVRWGSFSLYGVKLHLLLCSTNRVSLSYELTAANVAEAKLNEGLLEAVALLPGEDLVRRPFGDLAYRSEEPENTLAGFGILLVTERSRQSGKRQQVEIALASLKQVFGVGETLARTLVGLWPRGSQRRSVPTPTRS